MYTVMTIIDQGLKLHILLEQCSLLYTHVKVCMCLELTDSIDSVLCCVLGSIHHSGSSVQQLVEIQGTHIVISGCATLLSKL